MTDIQELLINGTIPISATIQQQTDWSQFTLSVIISLLSAFGLFLFIYMPRIKFSGGLRKLSKITGRSIVAIKHTKQELFSSSMIDQNTLLDLANVMNKLKGKDFDLLLHTPGGEVFSSMALSRLINQYPGKIRAIIPLYSMSGGSLLALSCDELLMTKNASLGPIDPQLGNLFKYGSARSWNEIVKYKGKKAEDSTISFAMTGKQYTKTINNHLINIIDFGLNKKQKTKLANFLTDGSVEHAYSLTINDLAKFGVEAKEINDKKFLNYLIKFLDKGREGVTFYHKKK